MYISLYTYTYISICVYVYVCVCVCVFVCVGTCILVFMKQAEFSQHLPQLSRFVAFVAFPMGIGLQIERANKLKSHLYLKLFKVHYV